MSYAEDGRVCLRWSPLRPDQGRLQAPEIPGRVCKYKMLLWLRACLSGARVWERVMKFTYATDPPSTPTPAYTHILSHRVGEVLADLLNASIIQHNVALIMHWEGIARNNTARQGLGGGGSGSRGP